jgi:hypothetical protein
MSSYAPLLAKEGHTNWNPDLIYFNNKEVKPTVGYYVQQLFSRYSGSTYLENSVKVENESFGVKERIGFSSLKDKEGNLILKMVNLLPTKITFQLNELDVNIDDKVLIQETILSGTPNDTNAKPEEKVLNNIEDLYNYQLEPYSLAVIKIKRK